MFTIIFRSIFSLLLITIALAGPEEEHGVTYASKCEVCKVVGTEIELSLQKTGKSHGVLEFGYSVEDVTPKKRKEYSKSELRLLESLEKVCDKILEYNIHKERKDSTRFAKGMSETFKTLHGLKNKGVKVELGIPYELWDTPSVEVTTLKSQCESLLETNEADIEEWYFHHQGEIPLTKYLCEERALKGEDKSCLQEKLVVKDKEKKKDTKKGEKGKAEKSKAVKTEL